MRVTTARLPPGDAGDDRIFATAHAVVMLDGSSAFIPLDVPASTYADRLGSHLRDTLAARPAADLRTTLADGITATAAELGLTPGESPSSTVTVLRELDDRVDVLMLGDNLVVWPGETLTDDRMDRLRVEPWLRYRARLATGTGYDTEHRRLLRELQRELMRLRNRDGGYWIAEANPAAADHALGWSRDAGAVPWAVLATDGAYRTLRHLGLDDWPTLVGADGATLAGLLDVCRRWEADTDPDGAALPRAKRHDDKTLAVVQRTREFG